MGSGCCRSEYAQTLDKIIVQNKLKWQNKLKFSFQFQILQCPHAENSAYGCSMEQDQ